MAEAETTTIVAQMMYRPDSARTSRIDALIVALKNAGVWAKLDCFYCLAAHEADAALIDWKHPTDPKYTMVRFFYMSFIPDRGYRATNESWGHHGYLRNNINLQTLTNWKLNSAHIGVWCDEGSVESTWCVGTFPSGAHLAPAQAGGIEARLNTTQGRTTTISPLTPVGYTVVSRSSASNMAVYKDAVLVGAHEIGSSSIPEGPLIIGGSFGWSWAATQRLSFVHIGSVLTQSEVSALHSALSAYLTGIPASAHIPPVAGVDYPKIRIEIERELRNVCNDAGLACTSLLWQDRGVPADAEDVVVGNLLDHHASHLEMGWGFNPFVTQKWVNEPNWPPVLGLNPWPLSNIHVQQIAWAAARNPPKRLYSLSSIIWYLDYNYALMDKCVTMPDKREQGLRILQHAIDLKLVYKDKIDVLMITNEMINERGSHPKKYRTNRWLEAIGDDAMLEACLRVNAAAPRMRIMVNDFALELSGGYGDTYGVKRQYYLQFIDELLAAGVKNLVAGIQGHITLDWPETDVALAIGQNEVGTYFNPPVFTAFLNELGQRNLTGIEITEMDCNDAGLQYPEKDYRRYIRYKRTKSFLETALAHPKVTRISPFFLSDIDTFLDSFSALPGGGAGSTRHGAPLEANPFDRPTGQPTEMLQAIIEAVRTRGRRAAPVPLAEARIEISTS